MFRKRYDNPAGKVVYLTVDLASRAYPEGTLTVSVTVYPVGPGSYSTTVWTSDSIEFIKNILDTIGPRFLRENLTGAKEMSDVLKQYITSFTGEAA